MSYYGVTWSDSDRNSLEHHGIKGQKWGIRRFQNEDGSLTDEGKRRYTKGGGFNDDERLNLRGMFKVNPFKYGAYIRKRDNANNPYKRKDGETKEEQKARIKEYEEAENKKFDEMTAKENELRDLGKRMNSFDKADSDEKFKLIDEVQKKAWELMREGGHDNEKTSDDLMDWFWQNAPKAGKARFDEYYNLPEGPERDQKLTQLLADSDDHGQDSEYLDALVDHMQKTHGDYISGRDSRSEEARKTMDAVDDAYAEEERILKKYYQEDQKAGKYKKDSTSATGWFYRDQLAKDHPEVKQATEKREAAWEKYCEQVLKDMGMPVNDKTIEYIQSVIIWN